MKGQVEELLPYLADRETLCKKLRSYSSDKFQENTIIAFYDTDSKVGIFPKSDFICVYDIDGHPISVTERLVRKNYKFFEWIKIGRMLKAKIDNVKQELGFDLCVTFGYQYIDYTHYKDELVTCQKLGYAHT